MRRVDLKRSLIHLTLIALASLLSFTWFGFGGSATLQTERLIENKVPQHVPLKIKLKKEKETKVRNLSNVNWFRDLEIEITNISDKPIYYFALFVEMADVTNETGATMVFPISYGRADFVDFSVKPLATDVPLLPKQIYTFVLPEKKAVAWEAWLKRNQKKDATKLEITFNHLSFGDGTGLHHLELFPTPLRKPLKISPAALNHHPLEVMTGL